MAGPAQAAFKQHCVPRGKLCTAAFSCGVNLLFAQRQILAFKKVYFEVLGKIKILFSPEQREQKVQISLAEH